MTVEVAGVKPALLVTNGHYLKKEGIPSTRTKVCIIGFAPSSMADAKVYFGDPNFEIWGINQLYIVFPAIVKAATRWFQIHSRTEYDMALRDHKHHEWLAGTMGGPTAHGNQFPIYMQNTEPDIPMSIPFPKDEIISVFGRYFTNTISWQIALVIYETMLARQNGLAGFTDMHIYGVDMSTDCTAPDVKVLTSDLRWVRSDSLKVGDEIIGFDENSNGPNEKRKWKKAFVTSCRRLKKPCYYVKLEDGTETIVSAGHGWLIDTSHGAKWVRTEKLLSQENQNGRFKPARFMKVTETWDSPSDRCQGYLAGAFDGEGHLSQKRNKHHNGMNVSLGFAQKKNAMSRMVETLLTQADFDYHKIPRNDNFATYDLRGGRSEFLRFLGENRPPRLLSKFNPDLLGEVKAKDYIEVKNAEYIGEHEVIGLESSSKTFIAEGFLSHNSEYREQRPSCEYFVGWARAIGINVFIPNKSDLCKALWLYPYEDESPFRQKIDGRRQELRGRLNQCASQEQSSHDERLTLLGALENMNYIEQVWCGSQKELALLKDPMPIKAPEPPIPVLETIEVEVPPDVIHPESPGNNP